MTGKLLNGESLEAAVQEAVRVLTALIRENQSHLDEYKGILVERYWNYWMRTISGTGYSGAESAL
ncbi:MAG: hypothetical protein ACLUD2_05930 [Clostridium sp.]